MALTGEFEANESGESPLSSREEEIRQLNSLSYEAHLTGASQLRCGDCGDLPNPSSHNENAEAGVSSHDRDLAGWQAWLCQACDEQQVMEASEIERAIKALDDMRRLNLEMELEQKHHIRMSSERRVDLLATKCCTKCLLEADPGAPIPTSNELKLHLTSLLLKPCFTCGCPCCPTHKSSKPLDGLVMCVDCEHLFTTQYVMDVLTAPASQRSALISQLLAVYDRNWLQFQQLARIKVELVDSLREAQVQRNHIHVGKSSVGIISGALGVAAAATSVAVPVVGTPLLVASLVLGGGAAAVQTTTSIHQHMLFRPQQQAKQLLYTHAVLKSILRVVGTLRGALVRDEVQDSHSLLPTLKSNGNDDGSEFRVNNSMVSDGCTVGRYSLIGVEIVVASRAATAAGGEAGTVVADVLQTSTKITRFAGGALAAVTLVLEAHSLASHIYEISQGSPCSMAQRLLGMTQSFPSASRLNAECQTYLNHLSRRERCMTESEVHKALLQFLAAPSEAHPILEVSESASPPPVLAEDFVVEESTTRVSAAPASARTSKKPRLQQLKERIEVYAKQRPPSVTSLTTVDDSDLSTTSFEGEADDAIECASVSSRSSLRARIERHKRRQHQQHKVAAS